MVRGTARHSPGGSAWRVLLRLRWPLGGTIAIAFAFGQLLEALVVGSGESRQRLIFDVVVWSLLGGLGVWLSLTWVSRQERRYQAGLARALCDQQALNRQLQRANSHLALLSDVNRHIADSISLDDVLDAALVFVQRLRPAQAAALVLVDPSGPLVTRIEGATTGEIEHLQERFGTHDQAAAVRRPSLIAGDDVPAQCLLLPLLDVQRTLGWIELYFDQPAAFAEDELTLLDTIASEVAEAIVGARRRSQEERAIYELERAIGDERARIARDIHDGIAQSLAFLRMRIDLWVDWLDSDRDQVRRELLQLKGSLREQIGELRRAIFALRRVQFDELGFAGGLHRYVAEFAEQHGWEVEIDLGSVPPALPADLEAICFRVVQESLTNVAKHADARHVKVRIDEADRGLRIVVADDGRGFDPGALPEHGYDHVGLRQMHERVTAVGGQLTLLSRPGAGAEVRAWIPRKYREHSPDQHG